MGWRGWRDIAFNSRMREKTNSWFQTRKELFRGLVQTPKQFAEPSSAEIFIARRTLLKRGLARRLHAQASCEVGGNKYAPRCEIRRESATANIPPRTETFHRKTQTKSKSTAEGHKEERTTPETLPVVVMTPADEQ